MATIFTKIIRGEIPCYRVAENDKFIAFLDINPVQRGHVLVVSKLEDDYIFHLPDDYLAAMLPFAKQVAKGIEAVVPCKRIGVAVIGLEVPHTHMHLVPINQEKDLAFGKHKVEMTAEEMEELRAQIAAHIKL
jgi:hypothetical protein